ncbi:MAG: hypothetical protein ACI8XO_000893 [Verrucomicrobiales bacterium]|jgi:hypothetical protein
MIVFEPAESFAGQSIEIDGVDDGAVFLASSGWGRLNDFGAR